MEIGENRRKRKGNNFRKDQELVLCGCLGLSHGETWSLASFVPHLQFIRSVYDISFCEMRLPLILEKNLLLLLCVWPG